MRHNPIGVCLHAIHFWAKADYVNTVGRHGDVHLYSMKFPYI